MANNSLYPGFVRISYKAHGHPHKQVIPCTPALQAGTWFVETTDSSTFLQWDTAVNALLALEKVFINTADGFDGAELWTLATPTSAPVFRTNVTLAIAGTSGAAAVANSQMVFSFRTSLGGRLKLFLMETGNGPDSVVRPPFAAGANKNLSDYVIAAASWLRGRDGGHIISPAGLVTKTNDALRKKYVLNV